MGSLLKHSLPASLLVLCAATSLRGEEADFVALFPNDGPPVGWSVRTWNDVSVPVEGDDAAWTIREGVLHSSPRRGTWLISDKEYGDFEIAYEFKLGELGNGGLALRTPLAGDPAFDGMEFQMADVRYNPQALDSEITGGIYRAVAPIKQVYKPTEWNEVLVRLQGTRLKATLNGVEIHDLDLATQEQRPLRHDGTPSPALKDRPRRGRIGFQELSRGDDRLQIRNARLRELPTE